MAGFLNWLLGTDTAPAGFSLRARPSVRDLIQRESEIGGHLFGPIPKGHHRQFFNLDRNTWIWYEEWSEGGKTKSLTTRYEINEKGILKVQEGAQYYYIEGVELANLVAAIRTYYEEVSRQVYRRDPATGKLLTV